MEFCLESGICSLYPEESDLATLMMGLNVRRKIIGDRVSPWKIPWVMGNDGIFHLSGGYCG